MPLLDSSIAVASINTVALTGVSVIAGFFTAYGIMKKTVGVLEASVKKLQETVESMQKDFNMVTRLEVMLAVIDKSVSALHNRQDTADEITRRLEIAFGQYQGQQKQQANWPPEGSRRFESTLTPPPRTAKKEREP